MGVNVRDLSPSAQKQVLKKLLASQKQKESKYGNQKVTVFGIEFDSKREARRYLDLKAAENAGVIHDLQMQVEFELIPAQYETFERYGKKGQRLKDGQRCIEKKCSYVADFTYWQDGERIVEDTKGHRTKDYIIKRKLMLHVHGIRIREV
jgi:hypothetical protein